MRYFLNREDWIILLYILYIYIIMLIIASMVFTF